MPALIVIGWVGFVVVGVIALVASDSRLAVYAGLLMAVAFSALGIESLRRGEAQTGFGTASRSRHPVKFWLHVLLVLVIGILLFIQGSLWLVLGWPE